MPLAVPARSTSISSGLAIQKAIVGWARDRARRRVPGSSTCCFQKTKIGLAAAGRGLEPRVDAGSSASTPATC